MTKKLYKLMNWADVEGIVYAEEDDPHRLLGPHVKRHEYHDPVFLSGRGQCCDRDR